MQLSNFGLNLIELGHFAAFLAMSVALIQGITPLLVRAGGKHRVLNLSISAAVLTFALTSIGGLVLVDAFVSSNFSVQYVARNSNTALPLMYKITALWGSHEGSLYLWAWILTLYTAIVAWHGRNRYADRLPVILAIQGWLTVGFFGLVLFLSNPFERMFPVPMDGHDLNPMLQDPGMAFHPPMLYLGYVGYSVPFAFAIAALLTRWDSTVWTGFIRRWSLVAWAFLTGGIILGGWWAYYELGWGGYWAWDPVENASFMPWLLGTALLHSITVQDYRRMMHTWNIFLVITTFSLSLLGTFLVRSGVLSSVHAFAVDPGRGVYILTFMILVLTISFGIFMTKGRYQQAQENIASLVSRESMFVWNNVVFTVACVCVLLGTLYPLALEAITGDKITVAAPYFNSVMVPIFILVAVLMAAAPLIPWRKANIARLKQRLWLPLGVAVLITAASMVVWQPLGWIAALAIFTVAFGVVVIVSDLFRLAAPRRQQKQESLPVAVGQIVVRNRRYWGGMTAHLGILIMAIGLVGSGLFRSEVSVTMIQGEIIEVGSERIRFDGVTQFTKDNYDSIQGKFTIMDGGHEVLPERRKYPRQAAPTTETGIDSDLFRDVYIVLNETDGQRWAVHAYVNPLVQWIWWGGLIAMFGSLYALSSRLSRRKTESAGEVAHA
ncbi:MAG: heme lyase CcmF/NrfE family subunit [Gammaproteobacteria bacterium]|nr:heme lyase CcmF/NrfE family subunit [Gammaproteobacteria bacterium]